MNWLRETSIVSGTCEDSSPSECALVDVSSQSFSCCVALSFGRAIGRSSLLSDSELGELSSRFSGGCVSSGWVIEIED